MAERVVLHIGTMKSGTTYLQGVLSSGDLERVGAFYPGGTFEAQTAAVRALLRPIEQRSPRPWNDLVSEVARRPGVAVYSQEFLSFARRPRAREIIESFSGTPVEVVLTARDQHGAIPAQWQSFTRNGGIDDWPTYLRRLGRGPSGGGRRSKARRSFRRAQDVPGILRRWAGHPGLSGVTVVVVPPAGAAPTELWRRFCRAARLEVESPTAAAARANESLGYASCDVLRRLNVHLGELDRGVYRRVVNQLSTALLPLRPQEGRPELDWSGVLLANRLNQRLTRAVLRGDVRVVGSLDELRDRDPEAAPTSAAPPDEAQVRRAITAAWQGCLPGTAVPSGDTEELAAQLGRQLVESQGGG